MTLLFDLTGDHHSSWKGILVKVYNLLNIGFLKWILNKVLSRLIYNPLSEDTHTHTHTQCMYMTWYRIRPLVKNHLNAKVVKDCKCILPTYLKWSGYMQQAHSTRPIFTSTSPRQKVCQTTVKIWPSRHSRNLTVASSADLEQWMQQREKRRSENKWEKGHVSRQTVPS